MRPGLVAVGVAFLVLSAGALITVNALPGPTAPQQDQFTLAPTVVAPHGAGAAQIPGTAASNGHLTVTWRTSGGALEIYLYPAGACPSGSADCGAAGAIGECDPCGVGASWAVDGPQQFPYELVWASSGSAPVNLSVSADETWNATAASPLWSALLIDAVAVALGGVGAVALFLGMFRRGGVYERRAPLVSRSADDAEEIARQPPGP